jgi:hypothetical protein
MKEYRLGNFARLCGYVFSAAILVGAFFAAKTGIETPSRISELIFHLIALLCIAGAIFLIREMKISRFVITVDRVYLVSMIYKRTLYHNQIRGWRNVEQEIHILPKDDSSKKIRVSTYFKDSSEIRYFLGENFPNLDEEEIEAEEEEIFKNEAFGITEEERAMRLKRARKAARYTEWLGWAITLWVLLYPYPYTLSIMAAMLYPILAIGICFRYRGLIRGDGSKNSAYPSVATTFVCVSCVLLLRALLDINTLSYNNGWILMAIIAVILFVLYQIPTDGFSLDKRSKYVLLFMMPLLTFCYAFGSVILINKLGDSSEPVRYPTEVMDKRISSGKTTTYYLELKKWDGLKEDEEVRVTRSEYEATPIGDSVTVYQYPGRFRMPWIELERDEK